MPVENDEGDAQVPVTIEEVARGASDTLRALFALAKLEGLDLRGALVLTSEARPHELCGNFHELVVVNLGVPHGYAARLFEQAALSSGELAARQAHEQAAGDGKPN